MNSEIMTDQIARERRYLEANAGRMDPATRAAVEKQIAAKEEAAKALNAAPQDAQATEKQAAGTGRRGR